MKSKIILLLKSGAIAGNILFVLWVSVNALKEHFSGTIYEKISYVALMVLLITNCFLLIRSFKIETKSN